MGSSSLERNADARVVFPASSPPHVASATPRRGNSGRGLQQISTTCDKRAFSRQTRHVVSRPLVSLFHAPASSPCESGPLCPRATVRTVLRFCIRRGSLQGAISPGYAYLSCGDACVVSRHTWGRSKHGHLEQRSHLVVLVVVLVVVVKILRERGGGGGVGGWVCGGGWGVGTERRSRKAAGERWRLGELKPAN